MQKENDSLSEEKRVSVRGRLWKRVLLVWVALAVFSAGVLVGQGRLGFIRPSANQTAASLPRNLDYAQVDTVYQALRENYDGKLSEEQVLDGLKHGVAQSTQDPYTEFFTAKQSKEFNDDLQGTITGIGAKLELDEEGNVTVVAPLAGSPAEAAGIRSKDIITTIDSQSTSGMTTTEAVLKIRGKKGTKVTLGIIRDKKESLEFTIVRDTIHVPSVESKILEGNVGYLQVSQFSGDTDELAQAAAEKFRSQGVKKVILDLRDNPGGEVTSAVGLSGLWLNRGDIVVEQKRDTTVVDTERADNTDPPLRGMKTVVLINGGSASASEITALAILDHTDAQIIGEKSYGKGVVQQLIPFKDGSALKVTVASWYSPKGTNINKKGIEPRQTVKPTEEDIKNKNDVQLQAAEAYLAQ